MEKLAETTLPTRDLLDEKQAAAFLSITPGTLSVWRSTGRWALPYLKIGGAVRYDRRALEVWLASRTRANGTTA